MRVLNYAESNIRDLTCDPTLSRVFDTAVKCFAKSRLRQKFIKMILNDFEQIIITEFGSYSVQNAFWAANMKVKVKDLFSRSFSTLNTLSCLRNVSWRSLLDVIIGFPETNFVTFFSCCCFKLLGRFQTDKVQEFNLTM